MPGGAPEGFARFWADTLAEAERYPLEPEFTPERTPAAGVTVFDTSFAGSRGHRIRAWLVLPRWRDEPVPCVVQFLGYGEGRGHVLDWLLWPAVGYATLVVDTRGQGGSNLKPGATPDPVGLTVPQIPGFVTRGVLDRHDYYYRDAYVDAARAVDTARLHPGVDGARVAVAGCSQGGQLALAAAALNPHTAAALVESPFLSAVVDPAKLPDQQPYRELLRFCHYYPDLAGRALATIAWFDAATMAEHAHCPALFAVGGRDNRCPPATCHAAYERYAGPKSLRVWPFAGHAEPNPYQRLAEVEFLAQSLATPRPVVPAFRQER
ncbi:MULTISPECIES: acetylxylan esterase [unclassified Kitasatospora]|uniref:acetylxylan esterase n=1 Tax=unclassified Kitasatospora TaxID=2633591 RepID=UPI0033C692F6